jgi:hypothetical protein
MRRKLNIKESQHETLDLHSAAIKRHVRSENFSLDKRATPERKKLEGKQKRPEQAIMKLK